MRVVIFANGVLSKPKQCLAHIQAEDVLIAADGGALHCLGLGINPHIVIGDFDSLAGEQLSRLETAGAQLVRHPTRKDYTDLELALIHARQLGANQVIIFGALGNRWDQTLANLLLPASADFSTLDIRLIDGQQEIFLVRGDQKVRVQGKAGDTLSLIPLFEDTHGITTEGLEYVLNDGSLQFGSTRGISNVMLSSKATITCKAGLLVGVLIHATHGDDEDEMDNSSLSGGL